jgi:chromosomal replication initiation ATPase DnaA
MRQSSRRAMGISDARQIGMYLAHKVLRRSMTRVGHVFGRDRTTVRHACLKVDRLRDRDSMDRALRHVAGALVRWSEEFADRLSGQDSQP